MNPNPDGLTGVVGQQPQSPSDQPETNYNAAVSIMLEKDGDDYQWVFYQTFRGEGAGCMTDKAVVHRSPTFRDKNIDQPPLPSGDCKLTPLRTSRQPVTKHERSGICDNC